MRLALSGLDAVRVLRSLRRDGVDVSALPRAPLCDPSPEPLRRFRSGNLDLARLGLSCPPTAEHPLCVAVPSLRQAPRASFLRASVIRPESVPAGAFVELGDGLQIPCPELLFVQMGASMLPAIHLAFGLELCGTFSRDPLDPSDGSSRFDAQTATSAARIAAFVDSCRAVHGIHQAARLVPYLSDEAWSPMEAVVAALLALPFGDLGYDLGPLVLNRRVDTGVGVRSEHDSRVPDILFAGTHVGLNYDGAGHLDIQGVADAAAQAALQPEDPALARRRDAAMAAVRASYVDDNRRDRELWAQGLLVMPFTYEDVVGEGWLDSLVLWVIDRIEAEGARDLTNQRQSLGSPALSRMRQEVVWSLLPGRRGAQARAHLAHVRSRKGAVREVELGDGDPEGAAHSE